MFRSILLLTFGLSTVLCQQKLVCYFNRGMGPAIATDPQSCTHVHYSYLILDRTTLLMKFQASGEENGPLKQTLDFKLLNHNLKVIATIGGPEEDYTGGNKYDDRYTRLVTNSSARSNFVVNAVKLLNQHQLDGLDFVWKYPACPNSICDTKHKPEKEGFASLLKELRKAFDDNSRKLSLSMAVNASKELSDNAFDYKTMASTLDYINVITYNDGKVAQKVVHSSPFDWCKESLLFWASTGVPKNKILMAVSLAGVAFSLQDSANYQLGSLIKGHGSYIPFSALCSTVKSVPFTKDKSIDGPLAHYKDTTFIYEDPISVANKAKWVRDNGFGGVFMWEYVSMDDYNGKCCKTDKPITKAVAFELFGKGADPSTYNCP